VHVVVLLSGEDGWSERAQALARAFAARDAFVIGVDSRAYLAAIASDAGHCAYPAGELEALSQFVQQKLARKRYDVPTLAGIDDGAALARRALAQAPRDTFRAALGLTTAAEPALATAFCDPHHPASGPAPIWIEVRGTAANDGVDALAARFAALVAQTGPPSLSLSAALSDLPLVELAPSGPQTAYFALILSGDGGWASLDREVGQSLAAQGIPVIGFDSLQYFWTPRTPDESADALERIVRHGLDEFPERRFALIGYSRGADVLPFMASRLPADLRARVALVVLIGPARTAEFEFHVLDWLGSPGAGQGLPIAPELAKLRGTRVLCIYGRDEAESACREIDPALATRDERPGGHHFDGDYDAVAARIAQELAR
jgi:type IV secretory pathway VirJ component